MRAPKLLYSQFNNNPQENKSRLSQSRTTPINCCIKKVDLAGLNLKFLHQRRFHATDDTCGSYKAFITLIQVLCDL